MELIGSTRESLLVAARQLFAQQGFKGTSIRAITTTARANLGSITYHFGSKRTLYHTVIERETAPIREGLINGVRTGSSALDKIESTLRELFAHIASNPELPQLVTQVLISEPPLPPAAQTTIQAVIGCFEQLIREGQRDGSIRTGTPRTMALSFAGVPMFLGIYRRALNESLGVDQQDPETRSDLVRTTVAFVRAGLAAHHS